MITKKAKFIHVLKNVLFKKIEPVSIVHFLTNRCNARCSFCFIDFANIFFALGGIITLLGLKKALVNKVYIYSRQRKNQ